MLEGGRHLLMNDSGVVTFDGIGSIAIADEEAIELVAGDAGKDCRISYFVAIEMEYRQYGAVANWIEEFIGMPRGRERAGFSFTVTDDGTRLNSGCRKPRRSHAKGITQFAALVN